ncbi:MAG: HD domain-containing protein [Bacteroidota bacterium]|nr:HD domain-containing protein [Bacteroidota bacterium]MDP4195985.1 HD domain-containing protein [Bacteroidota bacterium]
MLTQKALSKISKGEIIDHFLILKKCDVKTTKANKPYLNLELADQYSSVQANLWDDFEGFLSTVNIGSIVKISGLMDEYQGQPQVKVSNIRCSTEEDNVSAEEFLPKSKRDITIMKREFKNRVEKISNPFLKKLLSVIFNSTTFETYAKAPAGKSWHHSYLYGLLEHTLEIIKICDLMCDIHPEVNRDLLVSGAMMHDFGKIEELTFDSVFDYSDKGKLIGHIVISAIEINEKAGKISGFPEDLKNQLIHLVLSHQGKLEYASPVVPKTLESIILYQADELSAKTNAYKSAIQNEANGGNNKWTKYQPLAQTAFYISDDFVKLSNETKQTLFD